MHYRLFNMLLHDYMEAWLNCGATVPWLGIGLVAHQYNLNM